MQYLRLLLDLLLQQLPLDLPLQVHEPASAGRPLLASPDYLLSPVVMKSNPRQVVDRGLLVL
jgi:hypothetical protein